MDFVCIKQCRLFGVKIRIIPRIRPILRCFTIGVSPVSTAPIRCDVGDTCVTDGCCKDVGAGLQMFCHKTTITRSHTTHFCGINIGMFFQESLGTFYNIVCRHFSPRVDVTSCELFSKSDATRRLNDQYHVAHISEY